MQHLERLETRQLLSTAVTGVGTGLIAHYFADQELTHLAATRIDPTVDFDWGDRSPEEGVPADHFSVRWTGKVQAQFTETYSFHTLTDEGVALWVNGQLIIDNFTDHTLAEDTGTISLKAGELYDLRLEYYDNQFDATAKLLWSSPSTPKQVIPQSQLYADAGWSSGAWLNVGLGAGIGSVSSTGSTYVLKGGQLTAGGTALDQGQFFYQTLQGDGVVVAQLGSQDSVGGSAGRAGLMLRDSLAGNSTFAALTSSASGQAAFSFRAATGGSVVAGAPAGASGLHWLKLVRDGNFIRAYASSNGGDGSWTYVNSQTISADRTVYVGLFSTSGMAGAEKSATFRNATVTPVVPLGAGLDQVRDYSFGQLFVDVAKQARTPTRPNLGGPVEMDANGWPTADFMTILISGFVNQAHLLNGRYKVSFTGQADVGTWLTPGGQVQNKVYDPASNTTTLDLIVNASQSQDNWYVALQMTNSRRTPSSPLNSGVTNLKVIRPGYDPNTTQTFTNQYLEHLKQFSVLRFMDFTSTNNNDVADWSQRTTLGSARQSSTRGAAWEYAIQLANQLDKDVWINVPVKANDDYVRQLATMLRDGLEPDRVVYVEYSNEIWNGIFTQYGENLAMAIAEVNAGNSPLNADGHTNQIYWGWRRVAKRSKEIGDIFGEVWGRHEINARVRPVLAAQHANPETLRQGLEFIERTYGPPSNFFYAVGAAPYFNAKNLDNSNPNLTVDQYLAGLASSVNGQRYFSFDSFARRYGLQQMAYEGGSDTFGPNNIATKRNASLDPRMNDLVTKYLYDWYSAGGGLFNWFISGPSNWNTQYGTWGLSPALDNLNTPKIQGTTEVGQTPRKPLTFGIAVPATFDARAVAGATVPYSGTYLVNPGRGNSFDYFVRVPRAGRYEVRFNAATNGSNEQLRVAINGSDVRNVTLTNTGSKTVFADVRVGNFQLHEGLNLVRVTCVNQPVGWNMQSVTVAPGAAPTATPTVVTPASASPGVVTGTSTNLSVLGAHPGGEGQLRYSWEALNEQPMNVTFSVNGTNAAKNTTATFTRPGTYQFRVTITDGVSSTTSAVSVTVNQTITSVAITPPSGAIANGEARQFSAVARDQFGVQSYVPVSFTWSVDNGFGTIDANGLYTAPVSGVGTAIIRATTSGGVSGTATVETQSPRTPDNPANRAPQIDYGYYEGTWDLLPNFDALAPVKTGLLNNVSLSPRLRNDNFGFLYTGYVFVPGSGTYTFYTTSDDGSRLWVGGKLVVDNDGRHSSQERSGQIILDAGWHSFRLAYFEGTGSEVLSAGYSGPGVPKQAFPDSALNRVNRAPTVATPPAASPNPVIGTSADLTVVGADESGESALTYTWSTLSAPGGAPAPVFSVNGTNAARNSSVTFGRAGTYVLQVAISDGMLSTTATVDVVVDQTLSRLVVSPASATVKQNRTRQFSVSAFDQFDHPIATPPQVEWSASANGGSIDASGLYTAPDALGTYQVTAAVNGVSGSASVTVVLDEAPTVAQAAQATPNPVVDLAAGTTLSVLGADDGGEANLTYTWSVTEMPQGAEAPTFNRNGNNAAKSATVTFSQPGTYVFLCTISDGFKSVTSSVEVAVGDTEAPFIVTPASASPSAVAGVQTTLSVLAGNNRGSEAELTYSWSTTGLPPARPGYSVNGTNQAKNVTVTFTRAGTYDFLVTISNGLASTTSSVRVVVHQAVSSITVAPASATVPHGGSQQFTAGALDQFGNAMAPNFSWSLSSTGTPGAITQSGLYTAPPSGAGVDTVIASAHGVQATAQVFRTTSFQASPFTGSVDVGNPSLPGSSSFDGGAYTVSAGGTDIWGNADQFHFVHRQITGDGEIVARVASLQNTDLRAKAGVMFRETLAANSRHVDLVLSPDKTTSLQRRASTGGTTSTVNNTGGAAAPWWLKLVRSGNTFTGYRSADGASWTYLGATAVNMASTVYVGLALTSHNEQRLNTSTFDNVTVSGGGDGAGAQQLSAVVSTDSTSGSAAPSPSPGTVLTDGDTSTFYQSTRPNGAWIGFDFGVARTITQIQFAGRDGHEARLVNGKFQASNSPDFTGDVIDLYVIKGKTKKGEVATVAVRPEQAYRYVRYLAPNGSFGNVAEAAFFGA